MNKDKIKRYVEQRDYVKKHFEAERTGEQIQYMDQTKLLKPLLETQQVIQDKIVSGQDTLSNALIPFTNELRKRNELVNDLQALPFYNVPREIENVPAAHSTPIKDVIQINLDGELLEQTHRDNLHDLGLDLPSEVQKRVI